DLCFLIRLSAPLYDGLMFRYQTCDGTVKSADNDYPSAGSPYCSTIYSGVTSASLRITVFGDTKIEPNETFCVDLIDVGGAALGDTHAVGTITNDDQPPPTATVGNVSQAEGDASQYPDIYFPV